LYDWLKDNAPEEITSLFDKYCILRDNVQDIAEGTVTRAVNENTVDNVSAVTHILANMGRPFYSQNEGGEIPPHAAWLEARKAEAAAERPTMSERDAWLEARKAEVAA
jgi:hypothetical protein